MPIISLVTGYIYLVFGSYKTFKTLGFPTFQSIILSGCLLIFAVIHTFLIAKSNSRVVICPRTFAIKMVLTHFAMAAIAVPLMIFGFSRPTFTTKTLTLFFFAVFGYFLNIGPASFPTFSVSDPFYWNPNRPISSLYDRALKAVILAMITHLLAYFPLFWHTLGTISMIMFDVVLIGRYWEIAGLENFGIGEFQEEEQQNRREAVQDVHLD